MMDEETEQEEEDRLNKVMADLAEFNHQSEQDNAAAAEEESKNGEAYNPLKNVAIIEEIMQDQTKYNDYVNSMFLEEEKTTTERD